MRLITTCLIVYQAFTNGATISKSSPQKERRSLDTLLAQLRQDSEYDTQASTTPSEESCYKAVFGLYTDRAIETNPSGLVIDFSNGFCKENAGSVQKSLVPYFCFYTGLVLLHDIQSQRYQITLAAGDDRQPSSVELFDSKKDTINRFCSVFDYGSQERSLFLQDFYNIPDEELAKSSCETYLAVDYDYNLGEFDPIDMTHQLEYDIICAQEYAMIESLREHEFIDLVSTVRFSYVVSLESAQEANQILDYGRCTEDESRSDPDTFCETFYNWQVDFSMWSTQQTDKVCQRIIESLKVREYVTSDTCAFITSRVYQLYSWFLQDIEDNIISEQISTLNGEYQDTVDKYRVEETEELDAVNKFVDDLQNSEVEQERKAEEDLKQKEKQSEDVQVFIDDLAEQEKIRDEQRLKELEQQAKEVDALLNEIKQLEYEKELKLKAEEVDSFIGDTKEQQQTRNQTGAEYQALEEQAAEVQALLDEIKIMEDEIKQLELDKLNTQADSVQGFIDEVAELEKENNTGDDELQNLQAKANEVQAFIDEVKMLETQKSQDSVQGFIDDIAALEGQQLVKITGSQSSLSQSKTSTKYQSMPWDTYKEPQQAVQTQQPQQTMQTQQPQQTMQSQQPLQTMQMQQPQQTMQVQQPQLNMQIQQPQQQMQLQQPQQIQQMTQPQLIQQVQPQMTLPNASQSIAIQLPQYQQVGQQQQVPQQMMYQQQIQTAPQPQTLIYAAAQPQQNQLAYSAVQLPYNRY